MALRLLEYLRRINWSAHNCKMVVNLLTMLKEKGYLPALSKEECKLLDLMSQPFGVFPYAENNRLADLNKITDLYIKDIEEKYLLRYDQAA